MISRTFKANVIILRHYIDNFIKNEITTEVSVSIQFNPFSLPFRARGLIQRTSAGEFVETVY